MNKYILIILLNLIVIQFSNAQVFQPKGKIGKQFLDIVNFHSVDKKLYKKRSEQQRNAQIELNCNQRPLVLLSMECQPS